jgi:hypothetical protein
MSKPTANTSKARSQPQVTGQDKKGSTMSAKQLQQSNAAKHPNLSVSQPKPQQQKGQAKKVQEEAQGRKKSIPKQSQAQALPFTKTTERDEARKAKDRNIANSVSNEIEAARDGVRPLMEEANNLIAEQERADPKNRNEDELVKRVSPLIQQAGDILQKCNSNIRGMDPGGNLRMRAQGEDALPEERKAAKLLSELTGETVRSVQDAQKKLQSMPKAEKKMSGLWKMIGAPLVQIIGAVVLLVTGVLGLVAQLLNTVGLGQLIGGLFGKLGLNKILSSIGLDLKGGGGKGGLLGLTGGITSSVFGSLGGVLGGVTGAVGGVTEGVTGAVGGLTKGVGDAAGGLTKGVTDAAGGVTKGVTGAVGQVGGAAQGVSGDVLGGANKIGTKAGGDKAGQGGGGPLGGVGNVVGGAGGAGKHI